MSQLTLVVIKFAYLAILWIFVLSAISVIRSDMFGARVARESGGARSGRRNERQRAAAAKPKRGVPTKVVITDGANAGESAALGQEPLLIGRAGDAAIRLDDDYVSTRHARFVSSQGQWFVEDLGSTNGTYIGANRITQPTVVGPGTQVRIGKSVLELRK